MFVSGPSKRRSSHPVRSTNSPARLAWSACRWLSTSVRISVDARAGQVQRPLEPFEAEPDGRAAVQQRVAVEQEDVDAAGARIGQRQARRPQPAEVVRSTNSSPRSRGASRRGSRVATRGTVPTNHLFGGSMSVTGFFHAGVTVSDMDAALRFYRDGLGLSVLSDGSASGATAARIWAIEPGPGTGRVPQCAGQRRREWSCSSSAASSATARRRGRWDYWRRAFLPLCRRRRGAARPHDLDSASVRARVRW